MPKDIRVCFKQLPNPGSGEVVEGFPDNSSRFFYCAKASKSERGDGNNHPTVKPIALMEYLINLISRKEAIVLDPFAGSGTTEIACRKLNRKYIGIELSKDYVKIAEKRLAQKHLGI